ncbi:hypothetical protein D3C85_1301270 [compost metagenome]
MVVELARDLLGSLATADQGRHFFLDQGGKKLAAEHLGVTGTIDGQPVQAACTQQRLLIPQMADGQGDVTQRKTPT